ncbi:MAG TPA: cytosine permease, partial [Pseudonocardiaceae bacterium]|nr:cytosine permease [Pseudonocardiaceae bacterium]
MGTARESVDEDRARTSLAGDAHWESCMAHELREPASELAGGPGLRRSSGGGDESHGDGIRGLGGIERLGIGWVDDALRRGVPRRLFWPWTAANVSFFTVSYGVFVVGLGLNTWQAILAIVVGGALCYPVVGMVAAAGTKGAAPTMVLSRAAFGFHGNKLPTLFVYLSLVGWETVSIALGALATRTILVRINPGLGTTGALAAGFVITVALSVIVGVYGYDLIMRVQKWITVIVAVMTV